MDQTIKRTQKLQLQQNARSRSFTTQKPGQVPRNDISIDQIPTDKVSTDQVPTDQLSSQENNFTVDQKTESERIIFLKTHKTGSSTIQNIFYRYALGTMKVAL